MCEQLESDDTMSIYIPLLLGNSSCMISDVLFFQHYRGLWYMLHYQVSCYFFDPYKFLTMPSIYNCILCYTRKSLCFKKNVLE